jgi:hypothetical protein
LIAFQLFQKGRVQEAIRANEASIKLNPGEDNNAFATTLASQYSTPSPKQPRFSKWQIGTIFAGILPIIIWLGVLVWYNTLPSG